jgi:hypothetical protein
MTSPPSDSKSPKTQRHLRSFVSLVLGLLIGVFFHYMLYRLSLPSKPFIYVAF